MKALRVLVAARALRTVHLLSPLLLGIALLGPARPARAEGRITFTQMTVEHCQRMVGTCTWKLSCSAGGAKADNLLNGAKGGTAATLPIGKSLAVPQFPVKAQCTAFLDKAWIGTTWVKVAESTSDIPSGGNFTLDLGKGEEAVHVQVAADSLEMAAPAPAPAPAAAPGKKGKPAAPAGPRQWYGIFQAGDEGEAVVIGLEWPDFKKRMDALAARGVQLSHLKSYKDGKRRLWAGVFRSIQENVTVAAGLDWPAFSARYKNLNSHSICLADLETYDDGKTRLFTGVFREGGTPCTLWLDELPAFLRKWNELSGNGQRLIDLNVYRADKKLHYGGAFRTGVGSYGMWNGLEWDALTAKWKTASQGGSELVEVVNYPDGKKRLYDAVLRSSSGGAQELVAPMDEAAFAAKWSEMAAKGMRLVDLETLGDE